MIPTKSMENFPKIQASFYSTVAMLLGLAMTVPQVLAAEPLVFENEEVSEVQARDRGGHWTSQALQNAQVIELPIVSTPFNQMQPLTTPEAEAFGAEEVNEPGNIGETGEVPADETDRLFAPQDLERTNLEAGYSRQALAAPSPSFSVATESPSGGPGESAEQVTPQQAGSFQAYFTSARLDPLNARFAYPWRTNGKLFFNIPGQGDFVCSAAVLRPRLILTAGHCVHKGSGGGAGFYRKFLFVPAFENGQAPYQAWNARWGVVTGTWAIGNGNVPNAADYAIIELEDRKFGSQVKRIGNVTGWLGYRTGHLLPNHTKKIGYPVNLDSGQVMHQVDSESHRAVAPNNVEYGSDMGGGSSGGAWIQNFGTRSTGQPGGPESARNRIVGVTSYGYTSTAPLVQGSSILDRRFLRILQMACQHRAGNC